MPDYNKAWVYYKESAKKEIAEVDGVSGTTANHQMQGKGYEIKPSNLDPSKQALIDFRDNFLN